MNFEDFLSSSGNWALFGLLLITLELVVPGLVSFFLGLSALSVAALISFGAVSGAVQALTAWFLISIAVVILFQTFFKRFFPSQETYDEYDEDQLALGTVVFVADTVSPEHDLGRIHFRGTTWNARSSVEIKAGENAEIMARDGMYWVVRPVSKH